MPIVQKMDAAFCASAICEEGKKKTDYYCQTTTGLLLEVRGNGGRTYYFSYVYNKTRKTRKIARYNDITFEKARKEAARLRSEYVLGSDPQADKKAARAIPLYADLAKDHLTESKANHRSYKSVEMIMRRHILPRWGKVRLTDINPRDISAWLAEKRASGLAPATVEKIRVVFGRSFELGRRWEVPGTDKNPVRDVTKPRFSNARERYLTAEEAARLRDSVAASTNTQLKYIIGLLLLTGARVGEALRAEWQHVDVNRRAWHIPISKTGKSRYVPLSQAALDLIAGMPKFKGCPYLLPNPDTLKPFVSVKHSWQTARKAAGLEDTRIHDLRHSFASALVNNGVDLFTAGKILGHVSYQSTQRYSHLANDTLLAAAEAGAAKLAGTTKN